MNLPDSFYIALCMTILLVGAIYWVWTQIQYVQRKVNILENIVYELKTLCAKQAPPEVAIGAIGSSPDQAIKYPPAPSSVLGEDEDLLHETLHAAMGGSSTMATPTFAPMQEEAADITKDISNMGGMDTMNMGTMEDVYSAGIMDFEVGPGEVTGDIGDVDDVSDAAAVVTPSIVEQFEASLSDNGIAPFDTSVLSEDLQPGGVGSGVSLTSNNVLEGMNLKELRRLAQQRQIVGATDMRKKELIAALRNMTTDGFNE